MIKMPGKKFGASFGLLLSKSSAVMDLRRILTVLFLLGLASGGVLVTSNFVGPGQAQQVEQISISGVILDNRGQPMGDIVVSVDGFRRASSLTDANGSYSVFVPKDGNYIVTPFSSAVLFSPSSLSFERASSNLSGINFTGTRVRTFKVAGRIVDERGSGVSDVVIRVSDSPQILTLSGPTGTFTFDHLTGGTGYTLTPSKAGITFSPPFFTIPNLNTEYSAINFVAVPHDKVRISGIVTDSSGQPLPDVIVGLNGAQPSLVPTNSSGVFSFVVPAGGNYMIAPARNGYSFNPPSLNFTNVSESVSSANFVGTPAPTLGISGFVVDSNGAPMVDVQLTLSGSASGSAPTGPIGNYSFSVLSSGNYIIIPVFPGYIFSPPSRTFTNLLSEQISVNFIGTPGNAPTVTPPTTPEGIINFGASPTPTPDASPRPSPSPRSSPEAGFSPTPLPKASPKKQTQAPGETTPPKPQTPPGKTGPQDQAAVTNAKPTLRRGRSRRRGTRKAGRSKRVIKSTGAGAAKKRPAKNTKKKA